MDGTEELRRRDGATGADVLSDALDGGTGDDRLTGNEGTRDEALLLAQTFSGVAA